MAWVGGLFVLLTISVNIGVRMAVESTTPSMSTIVSRSTLSDGLTIKSPQQHQPFQSSKSTSIAITTPAIQTQHKQNAHKNVNQKSKNGMSESVVILTSNAEQEAQDIYDKALKQFDSYGVSTRQTCAVWEKRGCQCSGSVEELTLSCKAIGLNETPTSLPKNLIKL